MEIKRYTFVIPKSQVINPGEVAKYFELNGDKIQYRKTKFVDAAKAGLRGEL